MHAALDATLEQRDSKNASCFMNMVNTFYNKDKEGAFLISADLRIRAHPIWVDLRFWENTPVQPQNCASVWVSVCALLMPQVNPGSLYRCGKRT